MIWHILPHAAACIASDRILLLDLRQNRYFAVPADLGETVSRWLRSGEPALPPAPFIAMLAAGGVIRDSDPEASNIHVEAVIVPEAMPALDVPKAPIRMTQILSVATAVTQACAVLRWRPLQRILHKHAKRAVQGPLPSSEALAARAHAFASARRFVPVPRNCLLDSLALDRWLGGAGSGRKLVLGVTAHPFAAHCWLQTGSAILNDSYDRVSRYAPILTA